MKAKKHKTYNIKLSLLYKLQSKKKLFGILGISSKEFYDFCSDDNYREWDDFSSGKLRTIQAPVESLKAIHRKIAKLLMRIETPSWVISGKRGRSYVDTSEAHLLSSHMLNVDIKRFYPNSQREFVFRSFRDEFLMSNDVASLLADFVTYKGHIPTGSPAGQIIAYWAFKKTFERIEMVAKQNDVKISLYVDDLTFSSNKQIARSFLYCVEKELKKVGHTVSRRKVKFSSSIDHKRVTGVIIAPDGQKRVPNKLRYSIVNLLKVKSYDGLTLNERKSLLGKIEAGRQIEPDFLSMSYKRLIKNVRTAE